MCLCSFTDFYDSPSDIHDIFIKISREHLLCTLEATYKCAYNKAIEPFMVGCFVRVYYNSSRGWEAFPGEMYAVIITRLMRLTEGVNDSYVRKNSWP